MADVIPISRALARVLADGQASPQERARKREWERMKQAANAEESAGIRFGPAWHERERTMALSQAIIEAMHGATDAPYKHIANPCPNLRCYYCESRTETDDRLCLACQQFFRDFVDEKISEEEFAERDRYKRTVSRYERGDHLVRDERGMIIGT